MGRTHRRWYLLAALLILAPAGVRVLTWGRVRLPEVDAATAHAGEVLFKHEWKPRDPLMRFKTYLESKKLWSPAWQEKLELEIAEEIEASVREAEAELHAVNPYEMFDHVYAELTPDLVAQKETALLYADEVAAASSH